ncbi:cell wall hydrolase [Bartonella sp. HY038]|uniref:cell wall hydrolase n=1 Tax=Bartonella sp. HY038 TaxID=2759660 RepID=UPI0015FC0E6F|nr:cell wall hydrolase [Bartonella sp. HY038]
MALVGVLLAPLVVTGCSNSGKSIASLGGEKTYSYPLSERTCLERAMFFESNRSSREGMIAVGTVVMNRVNSSHYPKTICAVVGQPKQFAPGVLTRPMNSKAMPDVQAAADAVLRGERHQKLKNAMFFHTAGLKFPYRNMHYTLVAGGNAFYEKRGRDGNLQLAVNDQPYNVALAFAQEKNGAAPKFDRIIRQEAEARSEAIAVAQNIETAKPVAMQQVAMREAAPIASQSQTHAVRQDAVAAIIEHVPVPMPSPRAEHEETVALGYAIPEARHADVIGAMLLRQQNQ